MKSLVCCLISAASTLALGCCLTSCIYEGEGLCQDRLTLTIESDWTAAPDASPQGMAYIFFPTDGSESWRFDFPGRTGGEISMLPGDYRFLSYNDDTYNILFRGDHNYDTYEAYTPGADLPAARQDTLPPYSSEERVTESPDPLWSCAYCSFRMDYCGAYYNTSPTSPDLGADVFSQKRILLVNERPLTAHYIYRIDKVENLSGVKSMSAAVSGMAGSVFLASGMKGTYPSTISVNASKYDSTTISGNFYTFGIPRNPQADNILSLFVVLKDGRRFCYRFDVTDQIRSASDPMNVNLVLRGLTIEAPRREESTGFEVNVDGWETVTVNIKG